MRYVKQYEQLGKESFVHGNRDRKPSNTLDDETILLIVALYVNKYYDSNFVHYKELQ